MRDGQPREAAVYLRHRAGHRVPVYVRAIPLRDPVGAIVGAAEIFEEHHFVPDSDRRQDELGKLPNKTSLEGHTDAKPFAKDTTYGNWELSADRANAARRLMQQNGVHEDQVMQVRGYADQDCANQIIRKTRRTSGFL